jgi:hypothetical protein
MEVDVAAVVVVAAAGADVVVTADVSGVDAEGDDAVEASSSDEHAPAAVATTPAMNARRLSPLPPVIRPSSRSTRDPKSRGP